MSGSYYYRKSPLPRSSSPHHPHPLLREQHVERSSKSEESSEESTTPKSSFARSPSGTIVYRRKYGMAALHMPSLHDGESQTEQPPSVSSLVLSPILLRPVRSISVQSNLPVQSVPSFDPVDDDFCLLRAGVAVGGQRQRAHAVASHRLYAQRSPQMPNSVAMRNGLGYNKSGSDSLDGRCPILSRLRGRRLSGMLSQTSMESPYLSHPSSGNLVRLRNSSLGHSDPQISASSPQTSVKFRRNDLSQAPYASAGSLSCRRSLNASTSPVMIPRRRSPSRQHPPLVISTHARTNPVPVPFRVRAASSLIAPIQDNRRWSIVSLPSSSGYGTPGSNSAFSSEYSSQEQLCDTVADMRFSSNEGSAFTEEGPAQSRPRSRSLTSPIKFGSDSASNMDMRSSVYKERFPKAKKQMEEQLSQLVEENASLSCVTSSLDMSMSEDGAISSWDGSGNNSLSSAISRRSVFTDHSDADSLLRLISDGATRFLHRQIVEIANDCLSKSQNDLINTLYFTDMTQRLEAIMVEAREKSPSDSCSFLSKIVKKLLIIISRPARILECLEFDPDQFYHILEETEGVVREQLGAVDARVPDLPQYIIGKLGLDKNLLAESTNNLLDDKQCAFTSSSIGDAQITSEQDRRIVNRRLPCEEDYETLKLISNGAYGAVYLVRHKETHQRFAMKRMKKQTLIMRNQINQVYAERDILTFTDNPFVVSFYGSFETRHHLCMIMEYVEGGDCASLLKKVGTLPSDLARLYIAETVLAIEYLHSYGIVHRDLKPDNLLITAMGHVKLTDFGLSKIGLMNRATVLCESGLDVSDTQQFTDKQLCGTPEYIAPEVILRQGYGKPVDWWALGIIMYEFLIGIVPFMGETPENLFACIVNDDIEFPEGDEALPVEAEMLIRRLLEKDPAERLGTVGGAQQLMIDPFFVGLDFNTLLRQKAEFVPQLEGEEDTSYFDTRSDRYNHDVDSGDEDNAPMFGSFDTASPRHSLIGYDPSSLPTGSTNSQSESTRCGRADSDIGSRVSYSDFYDMEPEVLPTAVLLRRRFSAQRQNNQSTSSSGTNGTGCLNTACSSTDSSMDASNLATDPTRSSVTVDVPRRAALANSSLPRFSVTCEPDNSESPSEKKELSPVVESRTSADTTLIAAPTRSEEATLDHERVLQLEIPKQPSPLLMQHSPGGSISSVSSMDGSPNPSHPITICSDPSYTAQNSHLKASTIIRKGPKGYGFLIRSVRVYLGEQSDYYTIEHLVTKVDEGSPAHEAGLRPNDLITHIHSQPVSNLPHPQFMQKLLACGNELSLKVTPLSSTTIREGAPRHTVGKLAKKKPKRPQRRPFEKKPRKSSLLRRLSGKRASNDIIPGSSSQKQTFMPRSVSSQEGMQITSTIVAPPPSGLSVTSIPGAGTQLKRRSDAGLSLKEDESTTKSASPLALSPISRPSTLQGLKHKVAGMAQHLTTRKQAIPQLAVSPLARDDNTIVSRSRSPSSSRHAALTRTPKMS